MLSTLNKENWTQYQGTELEAIRENLADSPAEPYAQVTRSSMGRRLFGAISRAR